MNKHQLQRAQYEIQLGTSMQLQLGQLSIRSEGMLVGARPGKYLLLRMARETNFTSTGLSEEGAPLVVRYISKGNVYAFKSAVINLISRPERLLAIYFPRDLEVVELRNHPRLRCYLPGRLLLNAEVLEGAVVDISRYGCQFNLHQMDEMQQILQENSNPIELEAKLPGIQGFTQFSGALRNVHSAYDGIEVGLHFERIEPVHLRNFLGFLLEAHALPEFGSLSQVIHEHLSWRQRAIHYLRQDQPGEPKDFALSPDACALGTWLKDEGLARFGRTAEFRELDRVHRELHRSLERALDIRTSNGRGLSAEMLAKLDISDLSQQIAALLVSADEQTKPPAQA
ncbi:MAG: CZB domain-containing protein [Gammaproteobacteria bacterium]|nr:CZB domain-containing protein [Gammaproteobacteria bacterium]